MVDLSHFSQGLVGGQNPNDSQLNSTSKESINWKELSNIKICFYYLAKLSATLSPHLCMNTFYDINLSQPTGQKHAIYSLLAILSCQVTLYIVVLIEV